MNHITLAHILSNKIIQINKCIIEAHSIWSIYISSNRDLKEKIQLALNRSVTISHDHI
jgi:hypothetical protein